VRSTADKTNNEASNRDEQFSSAHGEPLNAATMPAGRDFGVKTSELILARKIT